jgi:beta-galactosidase/beta-glucuronidase
VNAVREMILRDRNHPAVFVWRVRANGGSVYDVKKQPKFLRKVEVSRWRQAILDTY